MSTPILFSPETVERTLSSLPSLAALLPAPAVAGLPSEAFPEVLRKTDREVYRWIANTHYEHLAEVVRQLEKVHAEGCRFGHLLTTTSREQFNSLADEALVAHDLIQRGYEVCTIERSGERTPDMLVRVNGIDVAVEVFSPRELLAHDAWIEEVNDLVNYVDKAADFTSSVSNGDRATRPARALGTR